ncbi:hypothetical protein [Flavobacterium sp. JP2137]|uniref:hypothetical protein n=1 Tax=Flavobacterium sp. JP2137 TaxID=3414510 RepID=UPI003D2FDD9B
MKISKSYAFQSFAIVLMATGFFLVFKTYLPKKIFKESESKNKHIVVDSLLLEAFEEEKDARQKGLNLSETDSLTSVDSLSTILSDEPANTFRGFVYMHAFYEKLYQLEVEQKGKVRIAYYGDSMTDGDMIVQDLRRDFQNKYGGQGVGFVSVTSESAGSRSSISHQFSANWKVQSYLNVKNPIKPFGINGHVFFAKDTVNSTWVRYKSSANSHLSVLNKPTLFYGKSNNTKGQLRLIIGKDTLIKRLNPVGELNTLTLSESNLKGFKADFIQADSIPFYGVNFDDQQGVHVDNFSNRGNSGLPLTTFKPGIMNQFQQKLGYQLIILHYGTNVLNYGSYNYSWYERQMSRVVENLRNCFPGVSILVVSTADKATKYDLTMQTDSAVSPLVSAQRKYAIANQTGFVNLYQLMGGDGSMVKWVEDIPAKANKDYTHFNHRGAKQVSTMIFKQLEEGYEAYKKGKTGLVQPAEPVVVKPKAKDTIKVKRKENLNVH